MREHSLLGSVYVGMNTEFSNSVTSYVGYIICKADHTKVLSLLLCDNFYPILNAVIGHTEYVIG